MTHNDFHPIGSHFHFCILCDRDIECEKMIPVYCERTRVDVCADCITANEFEKETGATKEGKGRRLRQ